MPTPDQLFRLLYVSESKIEGDFESVTREVEQMLAVSRRNNAASGLTGALIFNCGFFAQVLEGERAAVESVFEKIQHDHRHAKINVLCVGSVESRKFPNWAMAYVGRSPRWEQALGWLKDETKFDALDRGHRLWNIVIEMAYDSELSADQSFRSQSHSKCS